MGYWGTFESWEEESEHVSVDNKKQQTRFLSSLKNSFEYLGEMQRV